MMVGDLNVKVGSGMWWEGMVLVNVRIVAKGFAVFCYFHRFVIGAHDGTLFVQRVGWLP